MSNSSVFNTEKLRPMDANQDFIDFIIPNIQPQNSYIFFHVFNHLLNIWLAEERSSYYKIRN